MVDKKWIICNAHAPMYALGKLHMSTQGPTSTPICLSLPIIRELLEQTEYGVPSNLPIFEVKILARRPRLQISEPVRLTLDNYTMKYEDIIVAEAIPVKPTRTIQMPSHYTRKPDPARKLPVHNYITQYM